MTNPEDSVLNDIAALQLQARIGSLLQQATACMQQDDLAKAEALTQGILDDYPDHAQANYLRGIIASQRGEPDLADRFLARAIDISPNHPEYHLEHGLALHKGGRLKEAVTAYNQVIHISPEDANAYNNLGTALTALGRLQEAAAACRQAVRLRPEYAEGYHNLGLVLRDMACLEEALAALERAIRLKPDLAEAYASRGSVFMAMGYLDEAEDNYRRALELMPDNARVHSILLYLIAASAKLSPEEALEEQRRWDQMHGKEGRRHPIPDRTLETTPDRRLRVGYVSPDFRVHPVSYFFEPLLAAHDRDRFEVFCYARQHKEYTDAMTQQLRGIAEHWRFVDNASDAALARFIHEDGIDILIDLAGHTGGGQLKTFTYRPAPVQATYLGYFAGTGLSAMDYWITDAVLHPPESPEQTVEEIYRLPRCWVCYQPPGEAPPVAPCPNCDDQVVLGSFSSLSKLTPAVIETWCQLLHELPGSRLLLMDKHFRELSTRQRLLEQFESGGISSSRLLLHEGVQFDKYLATYARVDIVLDPFPRTGGTTTAEALWMGVPVVTLAGQRYVERISASKLDAVGLTDLITTSRDAYIDTVISLAHDPARRAKLRSTLRDQMAQSPLCDAEGLAHAMESAYESMWGHFLSKKTYE